MPETIFRDGVRELIAEGVQLMDVLPAEEYGESHLPGAINMPLKDLGRRTTAGLRRDAPVITYCHDYL